MKKFISLLLALIIVLSLVACGGPKNTPSDTGTPSTSQGNDNTPSDNNGVSSDKWVNNEITAGVPKPKAGKILSFESGEKDGRIDMDWTVEEMKAYVVQVKSAGFTQSSTESGEGSDYIYYASSDKAMITVLLDGITILLKDLSQ